MTKKNTKDQCYCVVFRSAMRCPKVLHAGLRLIQYKTLNTIVVSEDAADVDLCFTMLCKHIFTRT